MKTLSAFVVMLLISLILFQTAFGGNDQKKGFKEIPNITIESLIMGLNSENKGVIIGCSIVSGQLQIIETVQHLAKILDSDLSFDIKTAAVYALYQIQNKEALMVLKKASVKNNCPFLRQTAEVFLINYLIDNPKENVKMEEDYFADDKLE